MSNLIPGLFILCGAIAILLVFFFNKNAVIRRKLKNAEVKDLRYFKDGAAAKVIGHIEVVEDPLIAPLSKRECAYYHIHVERRVSRGKNKSWTTIIDKEVSSKYLIKDGNRYACINARLKSYVVQDKHYSSGFGNDATQNLENYLESHGFKSEGFLGFNKTLRYNEGVLEVGEKVAVFGKGEWKDATKLSLPKKYGMVLELSSHDGKAVYLSDDPDTT